MSRLLQGPVTLFSTSDARKKENVDARVRRSSTCKNWPYASNSIKQILPPSFDELQYFTIENSEITTQIYDVPF